MEKLTSLRDKHSGFVMGYVRPEVPGKQGRPRSRGTPANLQKGRGQEGCPGSRLKIFSCLLYGREEPKEQKAQWLGHIA